MNGLNESLLAPNNPNAVQPFRLDRSQFETADQDHNYKDEQLAFDHGLMDQFVEKVGRGNGPNGQPGGQVMGYYDGNTVTALWNYAQNFAMSDNSFSTTFGPSTPGALNLISGQTHGFTTDGNAVPAASSSVIGDPQPSGRQVQHARQLDLGRPEQQEHRRPAEREGRHLGLVPGRLRQLHAVAREPGGSRRASDYIPHHEPFQYFASTANLQHLPPSSTAMIGKTDQANHQYDLTDFWAAVDAGNQPAVSFLKAPAYQDGHAGYSDPLDEQHSSSTRSTVWRSRGTGRALRWSSPTTTPTAGTTTQWGRS